MTTFLLVRHASTDTMNLAIAGRTPNIHLSPEGRRQAERLGELLQAQSVSAVYSSPLERASETTHLLAAGAGSDLPVRIDDFLDEIDYGEWTGLPFSELKNDERWRAFNSFRSTAQIPAGESAVDVQQRMVNGLQRLMRRHTDELIVLVSHMDPIRLAICHYAGIPIDLSLRITIEPASVSAVGISQQEVRITGLNRRHSAEVFLAERANVTRNQILTAP